MQSARLGGLVGWSIRQQVPTSKNRRKSKGSHATQRAAVALAPPSPPSRVSRFAKWVWTTLGALVLATLTLIYDGYFATIPEIDPYGADDVSPWRIPFVIANNSRLFSMQDVNIACELHFMELSNHLEFGDFALVADPPGQAILAGTKRNYNCPIEHVFDTPSAVVSKASISIVVSYKTLQWSREPITLTFTVRRTATGYEWLEGDPLY